jgi:hypothetical protein
MKNLQKPTKNLQKPTLTYLCTTSYLAVNMWGDHESQFSKQFIAKKKAYIY